MTTIDKNTALIDHAKRTIQQLEAVASRRYSKGLKVFECDLLTSAYNLLEIPDSIRIAAKTFSTRKLSKIKRTSALDAFGCEVTVGDHVVAMSGYVSKSLIIGKVIRMTECYFVLHFKGGNCERRSFRHVSKYTGYSTDDAS